MASAPALPEKAGPQPLPAAGTEPTKRWRGVVFSVVVYAFVAFLAGRDVWLHGFAHTLQASGGNDIEEEVWFLAQTPWAIVHGVNPFASNWINVPSGLNLMDNTTMPLLGLLGAPITFVFGPIATLNFLFALGFAGSATTFFLMARSFVAWWPAGFVGGLLYGFSPMMVGEANAHLFAQFLVVPPLVVLVVHHFVRSDFRSPWWHGIALGACYVAQFYISAELFSSLIVISVLAMVVGGLLLLGRMKQLRFENIAKMAAGAAVVAVLCGGYGAWVALEGPQHIHGPAQSPAVVSGLSSDPAGLVVPTENQHFTFGEAGRGDSYVAERAADWHITFEAPLENGTYVGFPLLIVLVAGIVLLRRNRFAVFVAIMGALAMLVSMGSYLHVDGHRTGIPLPFIVMSHLPLLDSSVASRYASFFWLFAALLLALILDLVYRSVSSRVRGRAAVLTVFVAVVALLPLLPAWPYPGAAAAVPSWFTSGARSLPVGTTVVVYPAASAVDASAMLWQAMSDMTFRMPGGYAVFATPPHGTASFVAGSSLVTDAMADCASGATPPYSPRQILSDLQRLDSSYVVVVPGTTGSSCVTNMLHDSFGEPRSVGGVLLWRVGSSALTGSERLGSPSSAGLRGP